MEFKASELDEIVIRINKLDEIKEEFKRGLEENDIILSLEKEMMNYKKRQNDKFRLSSGAERIFEELFKESRKKYSFFYLENVKGMSSFFCTLIFVLKNKFQI